MKDMNNDATDTYGGVLDEGEDMTTISMDDDGSLDDPSKNMEMVAVREFYTPVQELNSCPAFINHEPCWALISQSLEEENTREEVPDIPLTYTSPSQLEIIDLHTSINQMRQKEFEYLKKLSTKEAEIERLLKMLSHNNELLLHFRHRHRMTKHLR